MERGSNAESLSYFMLIIAIGIGGLAWGLEAMGMPWSPLHKLRYVTLLGVIPLSVRLITLKPWNCNLLKRIRDWSEFTDTYSPRRRG